MVVNGSPAGLHEARARIRDLERRWSRFSPSSEVSRLNEAAGRAVVVSLETAQLVAAAVDAWRWSGGLFDPTVLPGLLAAGYDRSFERIGPNPAETARPEPPPARPGSPSGCGRIVVNPGSGLVILPAGVRIDLGGIAKGVAADWVVEQLMQGASGACANLGGDVRVAGEPPGDDGWVVSIEDPARSDMELMRLALSEGAVCTSSKARRRWRRHGREQHHLIDPSSGLPARSPVLATSVVAGTAQQAEVLCKAVMVAGSQRAASLLASAGASGLSVDEEGCVEHLGDLERFAA